MRPIDVRLRLTQLLCPRGYLVVPKEPTRPMIKAACKALSPKYRPTQDWVSVREKHKIRYRAMINAFKEK